MTPFFMNSTDVLLLLRYYYYSYQLQALIRGFLTEQFATLTQGTWVPKQPLRTPLGNEWTAFYRLPDAQQPLNKDHKGRHEYRNQQMFLYQQTLFWCCPVPTMVLHTLLLSRAENQLDVEIHSVLHRLLSDALFQLFHSTAHFATNNF